MSWSDLPEQIAHATTGLGEGIARDLVSNSALSKASAHAHGEFEADLVVLHGYYGRLEHLYQQVTGHLSSRAGGVATVKTVAAAVAGGASPSIAGVAAATGATTDAATSTDSASLQRALQAVQAELAAHLSKLHDTYTSYIKADEAGARTLTAAANPDAVNPSTPGHSPSDKPSGW